MTDLSDISVSGLWRVISQDLDPTETKEWLDAFGHRKFKLRFSSQGTVSRCQRVVNRVSSW